MKDYLIDTHAHIDMLEDDISTVLTDMEAFSVKKAILPAVEVSTQDKILEIINSNDNLYGMIGIFPTEAKTYSAEYEKKLETIAQNNKKIVAAGEIGLDYYWDKSYSELQKEVFIAQIKLANRLNLPIVVHDRDAHKDSFDILREYNTSCGVLFHCFSGSVEFMKQIVREGWNIAIGGVVTFKNAEKIKEVAKQVPLENLMLETDSPYLTPVPFRGKTNKPAYVKYVAEEIAKLRNTDVNEIINTTTLNAERFFGI